MQEYVPPTNTAPWHHATMTYLMNEISAASCINLADVYYHELWQVAAYNAPHVTKFITRLTHDINARLSVLATGQTKDPAAIELCNRHIAENRHWIERCKQISDILYSVDKEKEEV
jgi:hypothetical protein